ncbi:MAG: hypothetical protein ACLFR1_05185 [Spirochaetia bacterium]
MRLHCALMLLVFSLFLVFISCESPLETSPPTATLSAVADNTAVWGQDFTLSVTAEDGMTYQWYLDGVALEGQTEASLTYCCYEVGTLDLTTRITDASGNSSLQAVSIQVIEPFSLVDVYTVENSNQSGLPSPDINKVYVDGDTIYAGTYGSGLAISTDAGTTWSYATEESGLFSDGIYSMLVDGTTIYLGHYGGLSVSTDAGSTWDAIDYDGTAVEYARVNDIMRLGDDLFLATQHGVAKSANNGLNITVATSANGLEEDSYEDEDVRSIDADSDGNLYVASDEGVFTSTDGGQSWTKVFGSDISYASDILIEGSTIYIGASDGLHVTSDNGTSWVTSGLGGSSRFLKYDGTNVFFGSYYGGFYYSSDHYATFQQVTTADGLIDGLEQGFASDGSTWILAADSGISISSDQGENWTNMTNGPGLTSNGIMDIVLEDSTLIAGTSFGGVVTSEDFGATWESTSLPTYTDNSRNFDTYIGALCVTDSYLWADNHRTSDGGETWTSFNQDSNGLDYPNIRNMVSQGDTVYAATSEGVSVTENNGTNWTTYNEGNGLPVNSVSSVYHDGSRLYAGLYGEGLYYSEDEGTSWSGFSEYPRESVYAICEYNGVLYTGTWSEGVAYSSDSGETWSSVSIAEGLPDDSVSSVFADANGLYVGTHWDGIAYSSDYGSNWWTFAEEEGLLSGEINAIAVNEDYLFAGTDLGIAVFQRN